METVFNWLIVLAFAVAAATSGLGIVARTQGPLAYADGGGGIKPPWPDSWKGNGNDTKCVPDPKTDECPGFADLTDEDVKP